MTNIIRLIFYVFLFFLTSSHAFAASAPDAGKMLQNLIAQVPEVMRLVTALAYVMGFFFVYKGLMEFKKFGEQRTQMSGEHHIMGPLSYLFVGAMLIFLPSSVWVGINTFWAQTPNIYAYETSNSTDAWSSMTDAVYLLVQLIGTISFIRGLVILTHLGSQHGSSQPGTMGRAFAHIVAGILCINLYGFVQMISSTLGIQW